MKKNITLFALAVALIPIVAFAADMRGGEQISIPASEHIVNDVYLGGSTITSSASVMGDELALGGTIVLHGLVSGDLFVGGGNLTLLADVGDDVRAAGGTIIASGNVGGDAVFAGGEVQISGASVGGDVYFVGGALTLDDAVGGNVHARGRTVTINGPIKGNVYFTGDTLTLGKGALIQGSLTYSAEKEVVMQEGARVVGKVDFQAQKPEHGKARDVAALLSFALLTKFLMTLGSALVVGLIFKKLTRTLVNDSLTQPILELARGFVVSVMLPLTSLILLITVIGIPFGILGLISVVALFIFASIVAPIVLGSYISQFFSKTDEYVISWQTVFMGAIVFTLLSALPVLGWLVQVIFIFISIGAISKMKLTEAKDWR